MSEEFKEWAKTQHPELETLFILRDESFFDAGYKFATEAMQAKFDEQAEELAALLGFAKDIRENYIFSLGVDESYGLFLKHGLIDADGKPTPLLTGEN